MASMASELVLFRLNDTMKRIVTISYLLPPLMTDAISVMMLTRTLLTHL